ncbi:MAG: copper chaperone PCu(A)C [Phototrophicaceae bacterium]
MRFVLLLVLIIVGVVACAPTVTPTSPEVEAAVTVDLVMEASELMVGETNLLVSVVNAEGKPVEGATVNVIGNMNHAGMMPVVVENITTFTDGNYVVPFEWTMGGDWFVDVAVMLPSGEKLEKTFEGITIATEEGMGEMSEMNHSEMEHNMDSPVSAAYMQLVNNGESGRVLIGAKIEGVGVVELHEMTMENDVMKMNPIEGQALTIPTGETVTLQPGGLHIMLMAVEKTFAVGETAQMELLFADETSITIELPITDEAPAEASQFEFDGLTIQTPWMRPVTVETMGEMEMSHEEHATPTAEASS